MNPGITQGFIRFGSMAHRILLELHLFGVSCHKYLCESLDAEPREISTNLARLKKHKFIREIGKFDSYIHNHRTQAAVALFHDKRVKAKDFPWQKKTSQERTMKYRAVLKSKAQAVPSVFDWRGP